MATRRRRHRGTAMDNVQLNTLVPKEDKNFFFAVADNQDDAFGEALVAHVGHRHQELSFK